MVDLQLLRWPIGSSFHGNPDIMALCQMPAGFFVSPDIVSFSFGPAIIITSP
jgi:hypothetical protein